MNERMPDLVRAAILAFRASKMEAEENVVLYSDTKKPQVQVEAFFSAAVGMGVDATLVRVKHRPRMQEPTRSAIDAMKNADLVVDLAYESWLYTQATAEILEAKSRLLQVLAPMETIIQRPPTKEITRKANKAAEIFDRGETIKIKSGSGCELKANIRGKNSLPHDGAVVKPGDFDSLGIYTNSIFPREKEVNGTIVLNGTASLHPHHHIIIQDPITVKVENGLITDIRGGSEAALFEKWLESYNDENAYLSSHIGFGLDKRAGPPPVPGDHIAFESIYGAIIVAFGASAGLPGAGKIKSKAHADFTLLGGDFYIDDLQLIKNGQFALDELN